MMTQPVRSTYAGDPMRAFLDRLWRPTHAEGPDAPLIVGLIFNALPIVAGVGVLLQRHAIGSPGRDMLFVGLAILPWVTELAGITLPRLLFGALVIAGTVGLMLRPVVIDIAPFMLVFMVAQMAALTTAGPSVFWLVVAIGTMAGMNIAGRFNQALPWYFGLALSWVGGFMVRFQVRLLADLRAAQNDLAARAAVDERRRIARELHDVIAHSMTVMMLHVTGARRALDRDPHDAATALEEAERLGRLSLQDVRRTVGLLGPDDPRTRAPLPAAADVGALIEEFRAAGATITSHIDGAVGTLEPTAGLALYRIVQESLTNAAKHAPGLPVAVTIRSDPESTSLRVENRLPNGQARGTERGLGLLGMQERTVLLGGTFSAAAQEGRWIVQAELPRTDLST